jgi:hypothetical protein
MRYAALLLALGLFACEKSDPVVRDTPSAAPSATPAPASAAGSAAPVPDAPWYLGHWSGSYEAQHYLIETKKGEGLKQWADEDDKQGSGSGKLALEVDREGRITGTASGPLGEMTASGEVDDDSFRVQLRPSSPTDTSFQGFFVARRKGAKVEGRLQASSGDSTKVRDAPVSLVQTPPR